MPVERDRDRPDALLVGPLDHRSQHRLMTQMDAIEESDRCDGWLLGERERPDPAHDFHGRRAYPPCASLLAHGNLGPIDQGEDRCKRRPGDMTFAGWLVGINGASSAFGGLRSPYEG